MIATATPTVSATCSRCQVEAAAKPSKVNGEPLVPPGWTRHNGEMWCGECWNSAWVCRAVTVGVVGPADRGVTWDDLGAALRESWNQTRRLANWATREMAKADVVRGEPGADGAKMPKLDRPYLYPGAAKLVPAMPTGSVSMALRSAEKKYIARRFDVVWTGASSLPSYRNVPFPVRAQDWSIEIDKGGNVVVSVSLAGKVRHGITLATGGNRGARAILEKIAAGEYKATELTLLRQRAPGNHTTGIVAEKKAGGGQRSPQRVMCKIVVWLPKAAKKDRSGEAFVSTKPDSLLVAAIAGDEKPWTYHADQLRRWVAEHADRLQRMSDDRKAELRMPRRRAMQVNEYVAKFTDKHHDRIAGELHRASAFVVNYCDRRRVAKLVYDGRVRGYVESLPWSMLRDLIAQKCERAGIEFVEVKEDKSQEVPANK